MGGLVFEVTGRPCRSGPQVLLGNRPISLRIGPRSADTRSVDIYTDGRPTGFERGADVNYTISELEDPVVDAGASQVASMDQHLVRVVVPSRS